MNVSASISIMYDKNAELPHVDVDQTSSHHLHGSGDRDDGEIKPVFEMLGCSGRAASPTFEEVLRRTTDLSTGLHHVDPERVAQSVIAGICEGITSDELDTLLVETCGTIMFGLNVGCKCSDLPLEWIAERSAAHAYF